METLILRSPGIITNPTASNPSVDMLDSSLMVAFDANNLIGKVSNSSPITSWDSDAAASIWGASAGLVQRSISGTPIGSAMFSENGVSAGNACVKFSASAFWSKSASVNISSDQITVMTLIKLPASQIDMNIFSGREVGKLAYGYVQGISMFSLTGNTTPGADFPNSLIRDQWMVQECIFSGATARYIQNGVDFGAKLMASGGSLSGLSIGGNTAGNGRFLTADVAAIRVYNRVLTEDERAAIRRTWLARRP